MILSGATYWLQPVVAVGLKYTGIVQDSEVSKAPNLMHTLWTRGYMQVCQAGSLQVTRYFLVSCVPVVPIVRLSHHPQVHWISAQYQMPSMCTEWGHDWQGPSLPYPLRLSGNNNLPFHPYIVLILVFYRVEKFRLVQGGVSWTCSCRVDLPYLYNFVHISESTIRALPTAK